MCRRRSSAGSAVQIDSASYISSRYRTVPPPRLSAGRAAGAGIDIRILATVVGMTDLPIGDFLASLGLTGAVAERGRAVLEAGGITNPRKSRLSEAKLERARTAIDARFARFCASCAARTDAGGREVVTVATSACTRC